MCVCVLGCGSMHSLHEKGHVLIPASPLQTIVPAILPSPSLPTPLELLLPEACLELLLLPFSTPPPRHCTTSTHPSPPPPVHALPPTRLCTPSCVGNPWFKVKKVSKEQYREMLDRSREAAEEIEGGRALPQETEQRKSAKDRIDQSW